MAYNTLARQTRNSNYGMATCGNTYEQNLSLTNKALLAGSAMAHVAALSILERQFSEIAPNGANRYTLLADAYTVYAAGLLKG